MSKLKQAGFFRELRHGFESGPSLRSSISDRPQEHEERIVRYLRDGILLVACMGFVEDVLDPSVESIGPPHVLTDGVWAWPGDLAHYVERYHARLPAEFIAHMARNDWKLPAESDFDLEALDS